MIGYLANSVGPMAQIIIEDVLEEMEIRGDRVPKNQAAQLISAVAEEIPEPDQQVEFKKTMVALLAAK
jgi:ubiquinone/menaquinone biosynthesis C-methylase UbiE